MGHVEHIFLAPSRGQPMVSVADALAIADCGLVGDRYSDPQNRLSPDYQLTLIEAEQIEIFSKASGLPLQLHEPRRNIVTRGVSLNALCGTRFVVGEMELEGLELCEPCSLFAKRTHAEVLALFAQKGGLRARIVRGGHVKVGDAVAAYSDKGSCDD